MLSSHDREKLVESVRYYAINLANRFYKRPHPSFDFDDVVQAAMLGAIEAAQKYDDDHPSKANFMTFAIRPMANKVLTLYRTSAPVHIPRREYNLMPQTERGRYIWSSQVHLSASAYHSHGGEDDLLWDAMIPDDTLEPQDTIMETMARKTHVHQMVSCLPSKEQFVVRAVFGLNGFSEVRLSEIAVHYGVTRQRVHQHLTSALKKLERMATSRGLSA